jgi:hypothetical protein
VHKTSFHKKTQCCCSLAGRLVGGMDCRVRTDAYHWHASYPVLKMPVKAQANAPHRLARHPSPLSFLCCQLAMILKHFLLFTTTKSLMVNICTTYYVQIFSCFTLSSDENRYLPVHTSIHDLVSRGRWRRTTCVASGMSAWSLLSHVNVPVESLSTKRRRTPLQYANTNLTVKRPFVEWIELVHYRLSTFWRSVSPSKMTTTLM